MLLFTSKIHIIGVNPYMPIPDDVLAGIFKEAGKDKSPIPVHGTLDGYPFQQTLVKFRGVWHLYLNTPMRRVAGLEVGNTTTVELAYDATKRDTPMHPKLAQAFVSNPEAKREFESFAPYRQKEILRYLHSMKTEASTDRNVQKVIQHLKGEHPRGLYALMRRKDQEPDKT